MTEKTELEQLFEQWPGLAEEIVQEIEEIGKDETMQVTEEHLQKLGIYVRMIKRVQSEIQTVKEQYQTILKRLEAKQNAIEWTRGTLARTVTEAECLRTGKKSVITPWGTAKLTSCPEGLDITDQDKLIQSELPDGVFEFIESIKIDKKALMAYFKETGEVPDGCTYRPASQNFKVS